MKFKTPIFLLGILLFLAGIAYWDEWKTKSETEAKKTENIVFSDLKKENIHSLRSLNKDDLEGNFYVEKTGSDWLIKEPVNARADNRQIDSIIDSLLRYKYIRNLGAKPRNEFGLSKPRLRYSLTSEDGKEFVLEIGDNTQVGFEVYFSTSQSSGEVLIGGQQIVSSLNRKLVSLRDKSLGIPPIEHLKSWTLVRGSASPISFLRDQEVWKLESSQEVQLDFDALEKHIEKVSGSIIESFVDKPSEEFKKALSLSHAGTKVTASFEYLTEENVSKKFVVLENNGSFYIGDDNGSAFIKLKPDVSNEFKKTVWDFQDKSVVQIDTNEVTKVVLDGRSYELDKGKNWVDSTSREPKEHIRLLLVDLEYAQAISFREQIPSGLADPKHLLSIHSGNKVIELQVWHSEAHPAVVYVKKKLSDTYFEVEKSILENFQENPEGDGNQG